MTTNDNLRGLLKELAHELRHGTDLGLWQCRQREADRIDAALAAPNSGEVVRDAERYRYIAALPDVWAVLGDEYDLPSEHDGAEDFSAAIDADMAENKAPAKAEPECNCPGRGHQDHKFHAPNCPVRKEASTDE